MIDCNEWRIEKQLECANMGKNKTTRIVMVTVPHVTSGLGQKISGRWIFVDTSVQDVISVMAAYYDLSGVRAHKSHRS